MTASPTFTAKKIKSVAVVDDELLSRETTEMLVAQAGLTPIAMGKFFGSVEELVSTISAKADAAIIDHRLQPGNLGHFFGAEAVAALFRAGRPAILTTQWLDQDFDVTIRNYREWLPVVIAYDDVGPEQVLRGLMAVQEELAGKIPAARRPHRTQLVIKAVRTENSSELYDAVIPSWNPKHVVSFPAALVSKGLGAAEVGQWLEADVNVDAEKAEDLFFLNFSKGREADPNDGLA